MRPMDLPVALALAAAASAGCFIEGYEQQEVVYGTATLPWSIRGRSDAGACEERGVSEVHVVLRAEDGRVLADERLACAASGARYVLRRGWYEASLTLLEASERPISETRSTGPFFVSAGRDTLVRTDFVAVGGPGGGPEPTSADGRETSSGP
jgi:hypothetical protein